MRDSERARAAWCSGVCVPGALEHGEDTNTEVSLAVEYAY